MGMCTIEGCDRISSRLGMCEMHYRRLKRTGSARSGSVERVRHAGDAVARFHQKYIPEPNTGCWLWDGPAGAAGGNNVLYGRHSDDDGKSVAAHRFSYENHKGPIPDGLFVCHKCDTPLCVNPSHLFLGTPADNTADMMRKGRHVPMAFPGTSNPNSKLTDAQILGIALMDGPLRVAAAVYGVSLTTVSRIRRSIKEAA